MAYTILFPDGSKLSGYAWFSVAQMDAKKIEGTIIYDHLVRFKLIGGVWERIFGNDVSINEWLHGK